MDWKTEVVERYEGYELVKITSAAGDVIYNANSQFKDPKRITCSASTLEELKKQVDNVIDLIYSYRMIEYKFKVKRGSK